MNCKVLVPYILKLFDWIKSLFKKGDKMQNTLDSKKQNDVKIGGDIKAGDNASITVTQTVNQTVNEGDKKSFSLTEKEQICLKIIKEHNIIFIKGIGGIVHIFDKNENDVTPPTFSNDECQDIPNILKNLVNAGMICEIINEDGYKEYRLLS